MYSVPITLIDYPLDTKQIVAIAEQARPLAQPYTDRRYQTTDFSFWLQAKVAHPYIYKIMEDFDVPSRCLPLMYWQAPNSEISLHIDYKTQCAINFIIDDDDPAPIRFRDRQGDNEYYYKQALIDTSRLHSVRNGPKQRLLLKLAILNETYQGFAERMKFKLKES